MRVFAVLALALPLLAVAQTRSIQPSKADINAARAANPQRRAALQAEASHSRMTNARRMKLGLPPMRPRNIAPHRRGTPTIAIIDARAASSPSPSSAPSGTPPPPSLKAVVKITNKSDGTFIGFIAKDAPLFGEFTPATTIGAALEVTVPGGLRPGLNGPVDLLSTDASAPFPFAGAITGFAATDDTLAAGSFNYKYIGGVLQSPAHSPPDMQFNAFTAATGIAERTESAIWTVNTVSGEVTATWVNPDGRDAPSTLALYVPDDVLVLVGDLDAFVAEFGETVPVTLSLFVTDS